MLNIKIVFFNFPGLKKIDKIKKIKNHLKPPNLGRQSFSKQFQENPNIFFGFSLTF